MKYNFTFLFAGLFAFLFTGCEKEIDLDHLRPAPKLVVNSICTADSLVKVHVSRTWFHTDEQKNVTLTDAEVRLYVNDIYQGQLAFQEWGTDLNYVNGYLSGYRAAPGDRIRITASAPGFKQAEAETTVPKANPVLDMRVEVKKDSTYQNGWYQIRKFETYHFEIQDDGTQDNFYQLDCLRGTPQLAILDNNDSIWTYFWDQVTLDYSADPVYDTHFTSLDKIFGYGWLATGFGRAFTDKLFNGKKYTIRLPLKYPHTIYESSIPPEENYYYIPEENRPPVLYRVCLYSLSGSYYKYLKTLQDKNEDTFSNNLVEAGMADPLRVYTNVREGTGIVGGANGDYREIPGTLLP